MVVTWLLAFHLGPGMTLARRIATGFAGLFHTPILHQLALSVPHLSDPKPFALWFILIVGVALFRGRRRTALILGGVLIFSSLSTSLLKPMLAHLRLSLGDPVGHLAWQSGHATASMAVALCAVIAAPVRWRPFVAVLGAVYTLAVTLTLLVAAWHYPSDVVGGYLMAGTWTAPGVAALWALEVRRPSVARAARPLSVWEALAPALTVVAAVVFVAILVALARPEQALDYARGHTSFVIGAAFLTALGLSLVAVLSAAMTATRAQSASEEVYAGAAPATGPARGGMASSRRTP